MLTVVPPKPDDTAPKPKSRDPHPTVKLDPSTIKPSWPIVLAYLEQLGLDGMAIRLGVISLMYGELRELAKPRAAPEHVNRLRDLVEVLAHLPLDR